VVIIVTSLIYKNHTFLGFD